MLSLSMITMTLSDGDRWRGVCPFCSGGTSNELSFSVVRERNRALYVCHRASCGIKGSYKYNGLEPDTSTDTKPVSRLTRYTGLYQKLRPEQIKYLTDTFEIGQSDLKVMIMSSTDDGKIIIPIRTDNGQIVGEEIKNYPEITGLHTATKSKIYIDAWVPVMSWYKLPKWRADQMYLTTGARHNPKVLVIVEDQISARKACNVCDAVALLGTNLSDDKLLVIAEHNYDRVILALDSDAFKKSTKQFRRSQALIQNLQLVRLGADIKNMKYVDIVSLVN